MGAWKDSNRRHRGSSRLITATLEVVDDCVHYPIIQYLLLSGKTRIISLPAFKMHSYQFHLMSAFVYWGTSDSSCCKGGNNVSCVPGVLSGGEIRRDINVLKPVLEQQGSVLVSTVPQMV